MEWPSIINNTELCVLSQKIFLHLYDLRVWYMKVLITFVLLLAAWAGCPLEVMAQQANTTVSRTTVAKDKEPDSVEISAYDNKIVVENAPAGSKLEVYSVVGIRVKEIPMANIRWTLPRVTTSSASATRSVKCPSANTRSGSP